MQKINFYKFDILGIFPLADVQDIESLVTPLKNGLFLSRNAHYYQQKTYEQHSLEREYLKTLLAKHPTGEKAFIILEHMLNLSAKVFYHEIEKKTKGNARDFSVVKQCIEEDCQNLIRVIEGKEALPVLHILPSSQEITVHRQIELDNKALLYLFVKNIHFAQKTDIIAPGLGAIYIGPFFKAMHSCDYVNVDISLYKKNNIDIAALQSVDIFDFATDVSVLLSKNPKILLDDNVGQGESLDLILTLLAKHGITPQKGAVQYNWINYSLVENDGKNIKKFNAPEYDYLTPFNYPGHKLLEHAVEKLAVSGAAYTDYLNGKDYLQAYHKASPICDLRGLLNRGVYYARTCDISFNPAVNSENSKSSCKLKDTAIELSHALLSDVKKIELQQGVAIES